MKKSKRLLSLLLALVMMFSLVESSVVTAWADSNRVRVIVENTTFSVADGAPWAGTLVDEWVNIDAESTMMSCVVDALGDYSQTGAESNYISEINGLKAFDGGTMSGWMGTLHDWFTNEGFGAFTVANGKLEAGDEIRIMYTCNGYGADLGGTWGNSDKSVKALSFSTGTLDKTFDKDTHEYTLTVPAETTGVVVTPTASNKNYQVRTSVGETEYKRTATVPVADGTVITVKCGDPSWPTMNDNSGEAQVYTITVKVEQPEPEPEVGPVISSLDFDATPALDSGITFYGHPEGTLFQLDADNNRTDKTGYADDCTHYVAYVNSGTTAIKTAQTTGAKLIKNFLYSPTTDSDGKQYSISVYYETAGGAKTVLVNKAVTPMVACLQMVKMSVPLENGKVTLGIEFISKTTDAVVSSYTFMFVAKAASVETVTSWLEELKPEELDWINDREYVTKLDKNYSGLSDTDKAAISDELKAKLDKAKEIVDPDRVPSKLEIQKPASMLTYASGQTFDPTGMELLATYSDGTTRVVTDTKAFEVTPSTPLTNETEVTITYNTKTVKQPIEIIAFTLSGEGTEESPYLLNNAADLENLRKNVATGYDTSGKYFRMTANITLPDGWTPIGCTIDGSNDIKKGANLRAFSGIIDGNNKTLTVPKGGLPLLGYVKGAEVRDLNIYGEQIDGYGLVNNFEGVGLSGSAIVIENVTLKSGTKTLKAGLLGANITTNGFAGVSAGFVATLRNCTVEKGVVIGYTGEQSIIGSFAGRFQGTMENCVSYATVKGVNHVGGLMGFRDNSMGTCSVSSCTFAGEVIATGTNVGGITGSMYVGGWADNATRVPITNCTVSGTITGKENVGGIIGGDAIVIQNWGVAAITGNTFSGKISGEKNVGGIIGYLASLNKQDNIAGNVYTVDCGADRGIGAVKYVDTNYAFPTPVEGTTYVNSETEKTGISGMTKTGLNRTDDPLGKDADTLAMAVTDVTKPLCYKLEVSGSCKTEYVVGEAFDMTGLSFTAYWTQGKDSTTPSADEITVTGFNTNKRGQQTVLLSYGAAKAEIKVTVLLPAGEDITVTFSLLGDTIHGAEGGVHTLTDGNLTKWIDNQTVTVSNNATVLDVIEKALGDQYTINNPGGNYIQSITKDGKELGGQTNGDTSGWLYTLNGFYTDLGVAEQYLDNGDVIVLHYTDDYVRDYAADTKKKNQAAADDAIGKINAIGTVSKNSGSAIKAARDAYDGLTDDQKALVSDETLKVLTDAEAAYAALTAHKPSGSGSAGSASKKDNTTDKKAQSAGTGDDSNMTLWLGGVVLSAAALVLLNRKRRSQA